MQRGLRGFEYAPHAAFTEQTQQLVIPEAFAGLDARVRGLTLADRRIAHRVHHRLEQRPQFGVAGEEVLRGQAGGVLAPGDEQIDGALQLLQPALGVRHRGAVDAPGSPVVRRFHAIREITAKVSAGPSPGRRLRGLTL